MSGFRMLAAGLLALAAAACAEEKAIDDSQLVPVTGRGKILSIDQTVGIGTMEVEGRTMNFWWKNSYEQPALVYAPHDPGAWDKMIESPDSKTVSVPMNAQPGDVIYYRGLQSHGEVLITAATAAQK